MAGELERCRFDLSAIQFGWSFLMLWLGFLGLASAFLDFLMHSAEHYTAKDRLLSKFFQGVLKELTVLGFISMVVILVRDYMEVLDKNQFLIIEFSHLWLFCVGMMFVAQGMMIANSLQITKKRWDHVFMTGVENIDIDTKDRKGKYSLFSRTFCYFSPTLTTWRRRKASAQLWILRKHFMDRNRLPKSFEFAKFLRRTLTSLVMSYVEIGPTTWTTLSLVFLMAALFLGIIQPGEDAIDPITVGFFSTGLTIFLVFVAVGLILMVDTGLHRLIASLGLEDPRDLTMLRDFARRAHNLSSDNEGSKRNLSKIYGDDHNDSDQDIDAASTESLDSQDHLPQFLVGPKNRKGTYTNSTLTPDEWRLSLVLRSVKQSSGNQKHDIQSAVMDIIPYQDMDKYLPLFPPRLYTITFRLILLAQCYNVGLSVLILANVGAFDSTAYAVSVTLEFVLHLVLIIYILPKLVRDFSALFAVTELTNTTIQRIEETLEYQADTNESVYELSSVLYRGYEYFNNDIDRVFAEFLKADIFYKPHRGFLPRDFAKVLSKDPFHARFNEVRLKRILRALNHISGFTRSHIEFFIHGMKFHLEENEATQKVSALCFGDATMQCALCNQFVPVARLDAHSLRHTTDQMLPPQLVGNEENGTDPCQFVFIRPFSTSTG